MNIFKKIWNFLFEKKEEPMVLEESPVEEEKKESIVTHCVNHLRFRKNCRDCLRAVGVI